MVFKSPTRNTVTSSMCALLAFERIRSAPRVQVDNTTCGGTIRPSDATIRVSLNVARVFMAVKEMLNRSKLKIVL